MFKLSRMQPNWLGTFSLPWQATDFVEILVQANFGVYLTLSESRDSSVGIALDERGSRVRFPAGAGNFSLHHRVQNGSGAHPASYPMGTRACFPGGKAVGA
jgi:hypothetical protein